MVQTQANDDYERKLLDDVRDHGWHLLMVEADANCPGFVYSVGLYQTLHHPEVILFGLNPTKMMGVIINDIGRLIREGRRFENECESDELLEGYSCTFRTVPVAVYPDYLGFAMWYYRPASFPAVQCFWPDRNGRYPWQSDCNAGVRSRQPILFQRIGWRFYEPKEQAVLTTRFVLDDGLPILRVVHDHDGDWQFLCGSLVETRDAKVVCLESIVEMSPGISELADLPLGWCAERDAPGSPWHRRPLEN